MSSIGETLRRERLKRNLELDQISRELKIPAKFLEAIEAEHFDQLPAGVFAKSFVRQYATMLGLDAEDMVAEVHRMLTPELPPGAAPGEEVRESLGTVPELHIGRGEEWDRVGDRRNWSSSLPAFVLVVVVMLVCSGLYAFWQRERHPAQPVAAAETPRPKPAQAQTPPQPAAEPAPAQNPPAAEEAQATKPEAAKTPETAPTTTAQPPAAANSADTANRSEPSSPAPAGGPVALELKAEEPVWVLVRANGKYLFSGTLDPNQIKSVEANGTLMLRVGNAGGLTIKLNGKPIGPVGPKGQVRDVQFTSGGFQIVAAPKPPSPPGA
jgi:cytoskeleton protein RodZ